MIKTWIRFAGKNIRMKEIQTFLSKRGISFQVSRGFPEKRDIFQRIPQKYCILLFILLYFPFVVNSGLKNN